MFGGGDKKDLFGGLMDEMVERELRERKELGMEPVTKAELTQLAMLERQKQEYYASKSSKSKIPVEQDLSLDEAEKSAIALHQLAEKPYPEMASYINKNIMKKFAQPGEDYTIIPTELPAFAQKIVRDSIKAMARGYIAARREGKSDIEALQSARENVINSAKLGTKWVVEGVVNNYLADENLPILKGSLLMEYELSDITVTEANKIKTEPEKKSFFSSKPKEKNKITSNKSVTKTTDEEPKTSLRKRLGGLFSRNKDGLDPQKGLSVGDIKPNKNEEKPHLSSTEESIRISISPKKLRKDLGAETVTGKSVQDDMVVNTENMADQLIVNDADSISLTSKASLDVESLPDSEIPKSKDDDTSSLSSFVVENEHDLEEGDESKLYEGAESSALSTSDNLLTTHDILKEGELKDIEHDISATESSAEEDPTIDDDDRSVASLEKAAAAASTAGWVRFERIDTVSLADDNKLKDIEHDIFATESSAEEDPTIDDDDRSVASLEKAAAALSTVRSSTEDKDNTIESVELVTSLSEAKKEGSLTLIPKDDDRVKPFKEVLTEKVFSAQSTEFYGRDGEEEEIVIKIGKSNLLESFHNLKKQYGDDVEVPEAYKDVCNRYSDAKLNGDPVDNIVEEFKNIRPQSTAATMDR